MKTSREATLRSYFLLAKMKIHDDHGIPRYNQLFFSKHLNKASVLKAIKQELLEVFSAATDSPNPLNPEDCIYGVVTDEEQDFFQKQLAVLDIAIDTLQRGEDFELNN